jgi:nitrilase
MASRKVRVGVVQGHTLPSKSQTLQALESFTKDASEKGVALLLFPEAYLGGYPRSCSFGSSVGQREEVGREQYLHYYNDAVDLGDTPRGAGLDWVNRKLMVSHGAKFRGDGTREELERIAKETGVFLAVGLIERAGDTLYCATVLVCPRDGTLPNKRRKIMPTGTERLVWAQGDTSTLKAATVNIQGVNVTIGTAICWENYMPLLRYSLYAQNVNIWLAPTADGRDTWLPLMQTIAFEGRTFVLSCNQVVRRGDLPEWISSNTSDNKPSFTSGQGTRNPRPRRVSIVHRTQEGHEICLPEDANYSPLHRASSVAESNPTAKQRRNSSIIKAGNGIELCLPSIEQEPLEDDAELASYQNGDHKDIEHDTANNRRLQKAISAPPATLEVKNSTLNLKQSTDELISRGGSCIISPFGKVLKGPTWETEEMIIVELDLEDCVRGKLDFDAAGHYSRSDSFKLQVEGLDLSPP